MDFVRVLIWPKSEEKGVQLVRGSFIPVEVTSYKIHALTMDPKLNGFKILEEFQNLGISE